MKRELGIARCGLACCLCSENISCGGCDSGDCPDKDWCENRKCSIDKKLRTVMSVKRSAGKVYWVRSNRTVLQSLPEDMVRNIF